MLHIISHFSSHAHTHHPPLPLLGCNDANVIASFTKYPKRRTTKLFSEVVQSFNYFVWFRQFDEHVFNATNYLVFIFISLAHQWFVRHPLHSALAVFVSLLCHGKWLNLLLYDFQSVSFSNLFVDRLRNPFAAHNKAPTSNTMNDERDAANYIINL